MILAPRRRVTAALLLLLGACAAAGHAELQPGAIVTSGATGR